MLKKIMVAVVCLVAVIGLFAGGFYMNEKNKIQIESINFDEDNVFSLSQIISYADYLEKEDVLRVSWIFDEGFEYTIKLSDGTVIDKRDFGDGEILPWSTETEVGGFTVGETHFDVETRLLYKECKKALENGEKEIPVHISIGTYDSAYGKFFIKKDYTVKVKAVPKIVESFKIVSGVPEVIYAGAESADLSDAVFEIKYADGTVKTEKVGNFVYSDNEEPYYELDGGKLFVSVFEDPDCILLDFYDGNIDLETKKKSNPLKEIKITDYKISDKDILEWVEYTALSEDGTEHKDKIYGFGKRIGELDFYAPGPYGYPVCGYLDSGREPFENADDLYLYLYVVVERYEEFADLVKVDQEK